MKTLDENDRVAILRGNQEAQLVWGNWREKDSEWLYSDIQIECSWYIAILSIEFSLDKLKEFDKQLQNYENLRVSEFYPEYGDYFGLSLSLKPTGISTVKGDVAAKHPFPAPSRLTYEFESEFSSILTFANQIRNLVR